MSKRRLRHEPMVVKHWSAAGLMLTYWCNAKCGSCYVCCGPHLNQWVSVDDALRWWEQLQNASPHGCRIHLTGGEPFGNWSLLLTLCERAAAKGLGPLEKVETNGFWASDDEIVYQRLGQLDQLGMGKLGVSADPYHQQFIPLERVRRLVEVGREVLGPDRVQVRWQEWLDNGQDTDSLSQSQWEQLQRDYYLGRQKGRDRLNGRAVGLLAGILPRKKLADFTDNPCRQTLLRSKHVHVGPDGWVMPGTCAGIVLGRVTDNDIADIWKSLEDGWADRPILAALVERGPVGLLQAAFDKGFKAEDGYVTKCHLCWEIRRFLAATGDYSQTLGPQWMYEEAQQASSCKQVV